MKIQDLEGLYGRKHTPRDDLLQVHAELVAQDGLEACGERLAFLAADHVHAAALRFLLDKGVDATIVDRGEATLLHHAARMAKCFFYQPGEGDLEETVRLLLEYKVSALRRDENGRLCYHDAARIGNYRFVETLRQGGVRLTLTDREGNTGIHLAAAHARGFALEQARKAVEEEEKRGKTDYFARKALEDKIKHWRELEAQAEVFYKTVRVFADGGVDIEGKNREGLSAFDLAVRRDAKKIAAFLSGTLETGAEDTDGADGAEAILIGGRTPHQAVWKRDISAIKAIAKRGGDLNAPCTKEEYDGVSEGFTALGIACLGLDLEAIEALLECGANPSARDAYGQAAICYCLDARIPGSEQNEALYKEKIPKIVKAMFDAGLSVDEIVDEEGDTLLNYACHADIRGSYQGYRHTFKGSVIEAIMKRHADVNLANRFGETPLMRACRKDFELMERYLLLLLEAGAALDMKDMKGNTALHYAASNRDRNAAYTLCGLLLEFGADASMVNNHGETALDIATRTNNEPLVKILLGQI
ncbi:MAG: ankyrin repeat domain-containing protein [Zoogloeaceae bacterium]|jgi:ankyrin repeat protein|nr:ankyrin repeat domain-containing protein [Zoogloeaceae bacterium]